MQNKFILGITVIAGLIMFGMGQTNKPTSIKTWVSNDMKYIEAIINTWSKLDYKIKTIECQSVAVSESVSFNSGSGYNRSETRLKGDILLVMEK